MLTPPEPVIARGSAVTERSLHHGRAFASFGEIIQGRLTTGEDFLVTLPIDMWSTCVLACEAIDGPSVVDTALGKSRQVSESMLEALELSHGVRVRMDFTRSVPIGKGLSSSTADMLAAARAFQAAFGVTFTEEFISRLFTRVEPHDGLQYPMSVAYNHRKGRLLARLGHIPDFHIIAVDAGGELSTVEYNRDLSFTAQQLGAYDRLYQDLLDAFADRNDADIARCASRSAQLHVDRTGNAFLAGALTRAADLGTPGLVATHSGTCAGFLLPGDAPAEALDRLALAVSDLGRVFRTRTLQLG